VTTRFTQWPEITTAGGLHSRAFALDHLRLWWVTRGYGIDTAVAKAGSHQSWDVSNMIPAAGASAFTDCLLCGDWRGGAERMVDWGGARQVTGATLPDPCAISGPGSVWTCWEQQPWKGAQSVKGAITATTCGKEVHIWYRNADDQCVGQKWFPSD